MGQNAYGARTAWSDGEQQGSINVIFLKQIGDFLGCHFRFLRRKYRTEGVMKIGQTADNTFRYHFTEAIDGENDVPVPLETATIETRRNMGHYQVISLDVTGNNAVKTGLILLERQVIAPMQTGCGYECHPSLI
jgi:hypothetical protein